MSKIYLDSAAMHPVIPPARDAFLLAPLGNPSSEHAAGQAARDALEQAREQIAKCMDSYVSDVYFFSTASEAAATILTSLWSASYIIDCSPFEHHAVSENIYRPLNLDNSCPRAYCRMDSNNETGERYGKVNRKNTLWVCDATSSVGHRKISFRNHGADVIFADGIKFGSVPGAAFAILKQGVPFTPIIRGGGQEHGKRSGTENVPAICAMAAALEWQTQHMEENTEKISALQMQMCELLSEIPNHQWNTPLTRPHVHHILNISFGGVDAHALALLLSKDGVMVSAGAACSNGKNEPSHVIMNMFHDEARARSAIRISFCNENTIEEVNEAAEKIKIAVAYLRSLN